MAEPLTARERQILHRLDTVLYVSRAGAAVHAKVSGFSNPVDHPVLVSMAERGLVKIWPGEGRDRGLLLAQLPPSAPTTQSRGDAA